MILAPLLAALMLAAPAPAATPAATPAERAALDAAVRDLCGRDVALLGEADHGDGRTVAFKVALIQALVTRCHFNAIFFEASHYDFLDFSRRTRRGQSVSPEMISAAIGGMWNFDRELQPLIPFLFERARTGRLQLGGFDDQVGGLGAYYANDAMPTELAGALAEPRRAQCRERLRRRIYSDYGEAQGHYDAAERARILACLADIAAAVSGDGERLQMVASVRRQIARDADMATYGRERDRSMYLNFRWLAGRLPPRSRIILWGATAHMAKDASATGLFSGGRNFGAYVHEAYGRRAFALGFGALSGAHYYSREEPHRAFAAAAPGSLEALALAGSGRDAAYLGPARLAALGIVPGGALWTHEPRAVRWSAVLDGVVVFREERAPDRMDQR